MVSSRFSRIPPDLVLYTINVYQPSSKQDVIDAVYAAKGQFKFSKIRIESQVEEAIKVLLEGGLIRESSGQKFLVTYAGMRHLSGSKTAFPRDKHRLYWLKELLKRRDR